MTAVDVTIIDHVSSDSAKRELATRLTDGLISRDHDRRPREPQRWRAVAQAVPSAAAPQRAPDRRVASLDYAGWHAHLAGTRRWVPGGDRVPTT